MLNILDSAGGVNEGGADVVGLRLVPIKGGERGTELTRLAVAEDVAGLDQRQGDLPEVEEFGERGEGGETLVRVRDLGADRDP